MPCNREVDALFLQHNRALESHERNGTGLVLHMIEAPAHQGQQRTNRTGSLSQMLDLNFGEDFSCDRNGRLQGLLQRELTRARLKWPGSRPWR